MISIWIAFLIDVILGDPYWFPHPVRLIGLYISSFEKMVRPLFNGQKALKLAGILLTMSTVLITYLLALSILNIASRINIYLYSILNIALLWTCIAPRSLMNESMKIYYALKGKDLVKSRHLLSYIVGRDTEHLDEQQIAKATIETVAENTSDGVIAPLIYMFIGGAPLALVYKAVNTLDSMVGYKNEKYKDFGCASAKLDDIVNFIPARITGLILVLSAAVLRLNVKNSWAILKRDSQNHSSPNSGVPEAAVAGALNIQLGGPSTYFGKIVNKPTIGEANRIIGIKDIKTTNHMMYLASILTILLLSLIIKIVTV